MQPIVAAGTNGPTRTNTTQVMNANRINIMINKAEVNMSGVKDTVDNPKVKLRV